MKLVPVPRAATTRTHHGPLLLAYPQKLGDPIASAYHELVLVLRR